MPKQKKPKDCEYFIAIEKTLHKYSIFDLINLLENLEKSSKEIKAPSKFKKSKYLIKFCVSLMNMKKEYPNNPTYQDLLVGIQDGLLNHREKFRQDCINARTQKVGE